MRFAIVLTISICLLTNTTGRPSNADQGVDSEEEEYGSYSGVSAADQSLSDEDSMNQLPSAGTAETNKVRSHRVLDMSGNNYLQRVAAADQPESAATLNLNTYHKFSEYKSAANTNRGGEIDDSLNNDQMPGAHLRHNYDPRFGNGNRVDTESLQQSVNRNDKSIPIQPSELHDSQMHKRTIDLKPASNEEGEPLFEVGGINKNKFNAAVKSEYNNENDDSSEQSRYFKQYYNTMQTENRGALHGKNFEVFHSAHRDRRETQNENIKEPVNLFSKNLETEATGNEDEESAIRRHVKKLSSAELEELINSLSEDKKELLKYIMQNESDKNDGIIKREITKKASAAEENNGMDSGSDSNKILGASSDNNSEQSVSQNIETTENIKQPEDHTENSNPTTEITTTLGTAISKGHENSAEHVDKSIKGQPKSSSDPYTFDSNINNEGNIDSNDLVTSKIQAKRETNLKYLLKDTNQENTNLIEDLQDTSNNDGFRYSQNRDALDRTNKDSESLYESSDKIHKRDIISDTNSNFEESMKLLEESFPNSNVYDDSDPYFGSYMAPLVRVKRKNSDLILKKRSAALLPEAKVAFFPYRAENDDEDNDEGNEFDDDGFYDRTSNYAKYKAQNKQLQEPRNNFNLNSLRFETLNSKLGKSVSNPSQLKAENRQSETRSLGSDTDSVLSGVEGVDENLMYSSGLRNRRTLEDSADERLSKIESQTGRLFRSTPLVDDEKKSAAYNYLNAPNYQENDAFGPLPRNYEGELSRLKRIRRVKRPPSSELLSY